MKMKKEIFINSSVSETRIAILEDGKLVELFVERPENERMVGDLYLGRVVNVMRGMRAAFVDIGQPQDAFLHFSDVGEYLREYSSDIELGSNGFKKKANEGKMLQEGQEILVQIIKEPISNKGARVTTEISLPGRFLVLVPDENILGVSKKIENPREKRRLRKIARAIKPEGFGLIVRTVAEGKDEKTLQADLESQLKVWARIENKIKKSQPPCLIYKDLGMASSIVRDLFSNDVERLVVDNRKLLREISSYLKEVAPNLLSKVEFYNKSEPIFDAFNIESEIERSLARKVWLKSGGYIIFDHTEALVAIDVNSGKFMRTGDHEQNALKINLEAAREIARQLRLRDLGGIIVIDFIDMLEEKNKKKVYDEFKKELKKDRAQASITPISEFGLMQMTRERVRPSLLFSLSDTCPTCHGTGRVTSKGATLTKIERWIRRFKSSCKERSLKLVVHPEMAKFLTEGLTSRIRRIMWKFWIKIEVVPDDSLNIDEFKFFSKKRKVEITDEFKA